MQCLVLKCRKGLILHQLILVVSTSWITTSHVLKSLTSTFISHGISSTVNFQNWFGTPYSISSQQLLLDAIQGLPQQDSSVFLSVILFDDTVPVLPNLFCTSWTFASAYGQGLSSSSEFLLHPMVVVLYVFGWKFYFQAMTLFIFQPVATHSNYNDVVLSPSSWPFVTLAMFLSVHCHLHWRDCCMFVCYSTSVVLYGPSWYLWPLESIEW